MSFSFLGSSLGYYIAFSCCVSSGLWQFVFVFHDLESFKKYWSGILQSVPQIGCVWCFSHDETRVMGFLKEYHKGEVSFLSCNMGYMISMWHHLVMLIKYMFVTLTQPIRKQNFIKLSVPQLLSDGIRVKFHFFSLPFWLQVTIPALSSPHKTLHFSLTCPTLMLFYTPLNSQVFQVLQCSAHIQSALWNSPWPPTYSSSIKSWSTYCLPL